jgi:hypothetical protein
MAKAKSISTKALTAQVQARNTDAQNALKVLSTFDFTPAYELDRRLKADTKLLAEFIKNPSAVAKREVGLVVPKGTHLHFVNEKNKYFPPEGDAVSQLVEGRSGKPWTRVEIRSAIGPGCVTLCILCT